MARIRTFVALDPGKAIRDRLASLQDKLAPAGADVKWVERENLHVTMLFLGEVDERDVLDVCRTVGRVCAERPAFPATIEGANCFGNPRRPRTLWVGVGEGAAEITALHDDMETALMELGCYRREERAFTPHITLGRVGNSADELAAALLKHRDWKAGDTVIRAVHVMSSQLTPKGPIYAVLSRAALKG